MTKTSRLIGLFVAASLIATGCTTNADRDCSRGEDCERSGGGSSGAGYWGGSDKKDGQKSGRGGIGSRSGSSSGG